MRIIYVKRYSGLCIPLRLRKGQKRIHEWPYDVYKMIRCTKKHPHK